MSSRFRIALASLVLLLLPAMAWPASVRGTVIRASGGFPAAYIQVTFYCGGRRTSGVYTGQDGSYFATNIPAGTCVLEIWNTKAKPVSFQINVREPLTRVPAVKVP
jgi:hypothetical protein